MRIFAYENDEDMERIIAEQKQDGYKLVEVQNITEGNFLGFQPSDWAEPPSEETQLAKLQRQLDTLTAKASALATGQEMQEDVITEIVMHVYE